jgi:hypothetical protein
LHCTAYLLLQYGGLGILGDWLVDGGLLLPENINFMDLKVIPTFIWSFVGKEFRPWVGSRERRSRSKETYLILFIIGSKSLFAEVKEP